MLRASHWRFCCSVVLTVGLLGPVSVVTADTVVVTPASMMAAGWKIATQQGVGSEGAAGTAVGEFENGYGNPPLGTGSFHLRVGYSDKDPLSKVYLGTNSFSGIRLDKITQLKLWACPRWNDFKDAQPVTVELAVDKSGNLRLFTFKPWGNAPTGYYGRLSWREINLMAPRGAWQMTNTSSVDYKGDWTWLVGRYPGAQLVTPPTADWPAGTMSGTSLSIKIGAGKSGDDGHPWWWYESCGCNCYVDKLTVGYLNDGGQEVVTVYDFEPGS